MGYTGSISKGKVAPLHNLREFGSKTRIPDNIDFSHTKDNEVLVNRSLREVYDERFGDALEVYNAKRAAEGHYDNQIKDYLEHVEHSKTVKPMYEFVVQCGNVDEHPAPETAKQVYREWLGEFERQYGAHFAVKQAVIHMDEATPHMHLEVVPVAESKRGLPVQNSLNKAVEQSGFGKAQGGYKALLHAWDESLGDVMRQHGLERVAGDKERQVGGVPIAEYKAAMAEREQLRKERQHTRRKIRKDVQHEKQRLERLRGSSERVGEQIGELKSSVGDLEQGIKQQQGELDAIRARVGELESTKSTLRAEVGQLMERLERVRGYIRELKQSIGERFRELGHDLKTRLQTLSLPSPQIAAEIPYPQSFQPVSRSAPQVEVARPSPFPQANAEPERNYNLNSMINGLSRGYKTPERTDDMRFKVEGRDPNGVWGWSYVDDRDSAEKLAEDMREDGWDQVGIEDLELPIPSIGGSER